MPILDFPTCVLEEKHEITAENLVSSLSTQFPRILVRYNPTLKWQTVSDIIKRETAIIMYNFLNNLVPDYLSSLFI